MNIPHLSEEQLDRIIDLTLVEDLSRGDITSEALIPPDLYGKASILVKEKGILAGVEVAMGVFHHIASSLKTQVLAKDGDAMQPGNIIATITAPKYTVK